jgi:membrane protease subunit HflK
MAWNQPGNNGQDRDPWGSGNRGNNSGNSGGNNQGGRNQRPSVDDLFRKLNVMLGKLGNGGGNRSSGGGNNNFSGGSGIGKVAGLALAVAVGVWAVSGFYTIEEGREGVITRFGQAQKELVNSGLHWKPTFIDKVHIVDRQGNLDFKTNGVMLTSDENVVHVEMSVVYQVEDPIAFLFSVTDAQSSLKQASDSALRSIIGKYPMERILTDGKAQISNDTLKELVSIIANYKMGLRVIAVNLENARPPEEVKPAFDDAISAREDEQRSILQSQAYTNRVVPEAEGNAAELVASAKAYKEKVTKEAEGEVDQFLRLLPEYKAAPEVTRARLYISTMERIMANTGKILVDGNSNNLMVLPLDKLAGGITASSLTDKLNSVVSDKSAQSSANPNSSQATSTTSAPVSAASNGRETYSPRANVIRQGRQL